MEPLKKVLIITYFFPPCNLTASQRALGWARHLKGEGYQPIIITRNWDVHINKPDDIHIDSGDKLLHLKNDEFEAYFLPYKGNLRDKIYVKYGNRKFKFIRKILSLLELLGHSFTNKSIPFSNIYEFAEKFINEHKDVKALIITGNPFEIFRFGFLLNKKFQIPWIADYRDDWNTSVVTFSRGIFDGILRKFQEHDEKKWVSSAECITTISQNYANKIGNFVNRKGHVLLNGFFEEDVNPYLNEEPFEKFTIVYNGMLYPSQEIEVFIDAFKQLVAAFPLFRKKIELRFPGILYLKEVAKRVSDLLKGFEDIVVMTERIPRMEVLKIQSKAHLLLMVAHKGAKGIPSSKIYEYLGLRKPVLICPSDDDILEETFNKYNLGYLANDKNEAFEHLKQLFEIYLSGNYRHLIANNLYTEQFSRKNQAKVLAEIIHKI